MRFSVVINTCNRGPSLRTTLDSLRYQTHADFEVIVVNGPSTDTTDDVLDDYADAVRAYRCPERHLSKSRNIGIAAAAGDAVAFIDDDAVPEPDWLAGLSAAYSGPDVGGAGGLVYDHTGATYQYEYSACNRVAVPRFDIAPPFDRFNRPGADPFLYLQGTNCSFRRSVLTEIGGFNDEIEYYLDETEVCLLAIDAGYRLASVRGAAVHHKYLPSGIRDHKRVVFDPFSTVKNHCTFAVRYGPRTRPLTEVLAEVTHYLAAVKAGGKTHHLNGDMTDDQLAYFLRRTEQGAEAGLSQGLTKPRPFRRLPPADPHAFRPYPTLRPAGGRLKVCFASREYPPDRGGIGRFTADVAQGYADLGHEVHVVTHGTTGHTVDYEAGVWVHRVPSVAPKGQSIRALPLSHNLTHAANVYHEIDRIHKLRGGLDVVSGPIWLCEGAVAALDDRWPTVLTLHTTMKTIAAMGGTTSDPAHVKSLIAFEEDTARRAAFVYANSNSTLAKARDEAGGLTGRPFVVPHGTADRRDEFPRSRPPRDGKVRILFVGRIETRKGVDVLLAAAYRLLPKYPAAELVLVGRANPDGNEAFMADHRAFLADRPALAHRIVFAGEADDDALQQAYADCDVFVLPSRYESFGLVLTEAMMFGKPVVAVAAGGPAEVVLDGENGFLVPPDDAVALSDAVGKLVASADLRERFGERSRQVYEERFSTATMVANTLRVHREVIAAYYANPRPAGRIADRLAEVVRVAGGATAEQAIDVTRELLSPRFRATVDYPTQLAEAWRQDDEGFVRGVYSLLLGRPVDAGGLELNVSHLRVGGDRMDVVNALLNSDEARWKKITADWLPEFVPPAVSHPRSAAAAPPRVSPKAKLRAVLVRVKARLKKTPGVGKAARAAKHVVTLPIAIRRLHGRTDDLLAAVNALRDQVTVSQRRAVDEVAWHHRELAHKVLNAQDASAAADRQLRWLLREAAEGRTRSHREAA